MPATNIKGKSRQSASPGCAKARAAPTRTGIMEAVSEKMRIACIHFAGHRFSVFVIEAP